MREIIEWVTDVYTCLLGGIVALFLLITFPLWIIPYAIYRNRKKKEDPKDEKSR